ncbi:autotransporter outer membrane beta-barrel domain-containing protein [Serratia sp. D1N4]
MPFAFAETIDGGQTVTVPGSQSSPWGTNNLLIGDASSGTLLIQDGGTVTTTGASYLGRTAGSTGTVQVSDAVSWNNSSYLYVGYAGNGSLTISDGGTVSNTDGYIANMAGATGAVDVSGAGSQWHNSKTLVVGNYGDGSLTVSDGGVVINTTGFIGYAPDITGTVEVSGAGSQWNNSAYLYLGYYGNGKLTISDGGTVSNTMGLLGVSAGTTGVLEVSGVGSQWLNSDYLYVGNAGNGKLTISHGGIVSNTSGYIGSATDAIGVVEVSGAGSQWNNRNSLSVGSGGNGTLTISDGGVVSNTTGSIGASTGSTGVVEVSGAGSQWNNSDDLAIGRFGNGTLTIADRAEVSARYVTIANNASTQGTLNIGNGNLGGTLNASSIRSGAGSATVNLNHTDNIAFAPRMSGSLTVNKVNTGTTTLMSVSDYSGVTTVDSGTLRAGTAGAFSFNSDFVIKADGRLDLAGYDQTLASLNNAGVVSFNGAPGTVLTVEGDYIGNNSLLNFNTVLNDDASATDKLVVEGNTSGTTWVSVTNAGGSGAATLNGIELVQVNGLSDGEFVKNGRIVAGAYDYSLARGTGDKSSHWYLTSATEPVAPPPSPEVEVTPELKPEESPAIMVERPEASSYAFNLAAANNMFVTRLHDRLGETQYIDALTGERKVTSLWLRNEGGHNRSRDTDDQLSTLANRYVLQLGGDIAQWSSDEQNRLHLGVMAGYANGKSNTVSRLSGYSARGSVEGYSAGLYGTWYANEADKSGLYVDSWAQYSWFNNTVDGQNLNTEKYKSKGVTASVESGYTFKVGENSTQNATYFIQPKAQITWMGVKADDHKEANGTNVSGEGHGNIQTRLGVKAFINGYSDQDKGKDRVFQPFIETNWVHNTKDFGATMDGITVKQDGAANIAELKLGLEGQINKQLNLWGNVGQQIGDKGYSDTAVMLGAKYNF